jgi:hypothetical protein
LELIDFHRVVTIMVRKQKMDPILQEHLEVTWKTVFVHLGVRRPLMYVSGISSWNAYVLLLLLVQSQWRTLRSAG